MPVQPRHSDTDHLKWLARGGLDDWQGKRVIDLGCGSGYLCQWLTEHGARQVIGIDIEIPDATANASWRFAAVDLESKDWNESLKEMLSGNSADCILAFDIIEHLSSPWQFLAGCRNLLASGGQLIVTTPNVNSWERVLHPDNWSGARDPQHKMLFSAYSLKFTLEKAGFSVRQLEAPLRSAGTLASFLPNIGGQLFSVSQNELRSS